MSENVSQEESKHSEKMYAYNDFTNQINEPQKESNAIRRSLGEGENPFGYNNISPKKIPPFNNYNNQASLNIENTENLQKPNYADKSSEQRIQQFPNKISSIKKSNNDNNDNNNIIDKNIIAIIFIIFLQILAVVILATAYEIGIGNPTNYGTKINFGYNFHFLKDIHLMMFIGFGVLFCSIKFHQKSSIGLVLLLGVLAMEFSFFWNYLWNNSFRKSKHYYTKKFSKINLDMEEITQIDFFASAVIISSGVLLGKLSLGQYLITILFETLFVSLNYYLNYFALGGIDTGGSIYIYLFGAVYGFIISMILLTQNPIKNRIIHNFDRSRSDYYSNIISAIGSLFIWLYFPSFNTARIHYDKRKDESLLEFLRYRGIINTYMSMMGSTVASFITSAMYSEGKLKMHHILKASYAGGVIIAGSCTVCPYAWCALLVGCVGGVISIVFMELVKLNPEDGAENNDNQNQNVNCLLNFKTIIKISDSLNIMYCFGIPGFVGGIFNCIFLGSFSKKPWEEKLNEYFYEDRSVSNQAGIQIAIITITIAIAVVGGTINGFLISLINNEQDDENIFLDNRIYEGENDINIEASDIQYLSGSKNIKKIKNVLSSSEDKLNNEEEEEEEKEDNNNNINNKINNNNIINNNINNNNNIPIDNNIDDDSDTNN